MAGRSRRALNRSSTIVLLAAIAAAAAAWVAAGLLVSRAAATKLPAMPDRAALPAGVGEDIARADAAARAKPDSAPVVGDLGIVYHGALRPDEALQAYSVAEALDGADWRWTYYRGLLLQERGDDDAALEAFARVAREAPGYGPAHFYLAEIQFKRGRLDAAAAAYAAARDAPADAASPAAPRGDRPVRRGAALRGYAEFGLARIGRERGAGAAPPAASPEPVRAHTYVPPVDPLLDDVVARSRHPDLLLKHAALAARGGDMAWREWLTRRAHAASPRSFDVLLEMATMLQAAGKHSEALTYLRQCEEVAPGDHHTLVAQGRSLIELGRLDEAERVLRRAIRVRDAAAEYNLANALDRMERWEEARGHYERALEIDPFHARALNNLGIGLGARGQGGAALALFQRAVAAAPDNAEAHSNLGVALVDAGRFDAALAALDRAVALDPKAADAHNNRGIALAQLSRVDAARAAFEAALRLQADHAGARRNLEALRAR